jgi:hypothetical protein
MVFFRHSNSLPLVLGQFSTDQDEKKEGNLIFTFSTQHIYVLSDSLVTTCFFFLAVIISRPLSNPILNRSR